MNQQDAVEREPLPLADVSAWGVGRGNGDFLSWHGDIWSVDALTEALEGPENEGRIPVEDVRALLLLVHLGIAAYRQITEAING